MYEERFWAVGRNIMAFHCIFLIGWAITLIQAYVNRRYYLLALGGYEVEQRIIKER